MTLIYIDLCYQIHWCDKRRNMVMLFVSGNNCDCPSI